MRLVCLGLILLVAGCSTTIEAPVLQERYWQMKGKLSVSYEGKTHVVSVDWRQSGDDSEVTLNGPFGSGQADVVVRMNEVWIDTGEGPQRLNSNELLQIEGTSLYLPWRKLSYWIRGLTGPSGEALPQEYEQGLWQITTIRRNADGPELIAFRHPDIALRLRVQSLSGII